MVLTPLQTFGTAALCVAFLCTFGRKLARFVYLTNKIPGPSLWELVTVHAKNLLFGDTLQHLTKLCETYGYQPWGTWTQRGYVVFVSDCDTLSEIYKSKSMYDKPTMFYKAIASYIGQGLLTLNGPDYRRHRKDLGPVFRKSSVEYHIPKINQEAQKFVAALAEMAEDDVDVRLAIRDQMADVSVAVLASGKHPFGSLSRIFPAVESALVQIHLRSLNPLYYWLVHRLKKSTRDIEAMVRDSISVARDVFIETMIDNGAQLAKEVVGRKPTSLQDILFLQKPFYENLKTEGFDEVMTITTTGHDTTTFTTNVSLLILALHPEVQGRLFEEIHSIFGESDRPIEAEDLSQMVYLDMVFKETLRILPAAPFIGRKVSQETVLNGVLLPEGCTVMTNIFALHRNPNYFKDPLKFDPERFSPENSQGRNPYAFIPFSAGFRNCPGQLQAGLVIKIFLCQILRYYEVHPGQSLKSMSDIEYEMHFSLHLYKSSLRFVKRKL